MGGPERLQKQYICTTAEHNRDFNAKGGLQAWTTAAETIADM
jgi:hypothetical protein